MIGIALRGIKVDLRRQVGLGVDLVIHAQRRGLRVAEVFSGIGLMDALGEKLGVIAAGPYLLAFLADDGGRAGVLTERQDAMSGDLRVFQHHQGHHAVVFRGFLVFQNGRHLLQVGRSEGEVDRLDGLRRKQCQGFRFHLEEWDAVEFGQRDILLADALVFGAVWPKREGILVKKRFFGHGVSRVS